MLQLVDLKNAQLLTKLFIIIGIGYAMFLISVFIGLYYNVVIAWSIRYLFASMTSELPWASCNNTWNTASKLPLPSCIYILIQYFLDCRDFNVKDCLQGLFDSNRKCHPRSAVQNETVWKELETSYNNSRLPADEYFQ